MRKTEDEIAASPRIPAAGEGKRGSEGHIGYLLRQAGAATRQRVEHALDDLGVTHPQFIVMTMIGAYPGLSNADLARLAMLTPQTVSVIVGNLKKMGAVESRRHATHGRIQQLALSESGKETLRRCRGRVDRIERSLVDGVSAADEAVIRRWLAGLATDAPVE